MKYLRRGIWYLASRMLLVSLILALVITVFYYAMNLTNIQIILKDGMAARAKYIMGMSDNPEDLNKYFSSQYVRTGNGTLETRDDLIRLAFDNKSPYANYTVRGIDHRLDVDFFWIWPGEDEDVVVTIHERIPRIDGRVRGSVADDVIRENGAEALYPPDWENATYKVTMKQEGSQWKIAKIERVD